MRREGKSWQAAAVSVATLLAASDETIKGLISVSSVTVDNLINKLKGSKQTQTDLTKLNKPFGELDRATQLKLVEHVLDGGRVECTAFGNINGMFRELKTLDTGVLFQNNYTYRAIQP